MLISQVRYKITSITITNDIFLPGFPSQTIVTNRFAETESPKDKNISKEIVTRRSPKGR